MYINAMQDENVSRNQFLHELHTWWTMDKHGIWDFNLRSLNHEKAVHSQADPRGRLQFNQKAYH